MLKSYRCVSLIQAENTAITFVKRNNIPETIGIYSETSSFASPLYNFQSQIFFIKSITEANAKPLMTSKSKVAIYWILCTDYLYSGKLFLLW